jgi:hypothetical protein
MSDSQVSWNPRPLPSDALAADYMAELARATLTAHARRKTDEVDPTKAFWQKIEDRALAESSELRWRAADDEARVPIVADLFHRFPGELAVPAADALGFPGFLSRVLRRLVELDSERTRPRTSAIKKLFYSQLVTPDEIGTLLKGKKDLATLVRHLHEPPKSGRIAKIRRGIARAVGFVLHFQATAVDMPDDKRNQNLAKALRLLVGEPMLVRKIAEMVQMAVPFSIVLARELDEIGSSRTARSRIDVKAVTAALETYAEAGRRLAQDDPDDATKAKDAQQRRGLADSVVTALKLNKIGSGLQDSKRVREVVDRLLPGNAGKGSSASGGNDGALPPGGTVSGSRYSPVQAFEEQLFGVSFSGGGIRSATVNLGALQGLAGRNVLPQIDCLSTVSGGGYIGSWLYAWIKRQPNGVYDVQQSLSRRRTPDPAAERARPIRFLREYSNYLTPQLGLLGADTWTLVSTWCRNTVLNQLVLVSFLSALLLSPRALGGIAKIPPAALITISIGLFVFACFAIGGNLRMFKPNADVSAASGADDNIGVQVRIVAPLFLAAVSLAVGVAQQPAGGYVFATAYFVLLAGLVMIQLTGGFEHRLTIRRSRLGQHAGTFAISVVAAGAGAGVVWLCAPFLATAVPRILNIPTAEAVLSDARQWAAIVLGPPLLVLSFVTAGVVQIGLLGLLFADDRREWVSRLGAWLLIYALSWFALFACAIYGPLLVFKVGAWASATLSLTWIASTIGGLLAGRKSQTATAGTWRDSITGAAMYVFVAGLMLLLAVAIHLAILKTDPRLAWSWETLLNSVVYWSHIDYWTHTGAWSDMLGLLAVLFVISFFLGSRIDVNEFSMHHFYKNRLVRCFLGASRAGTRRPNPFTGFDLKDDMRLAALRVGVPQELLGLDVATLSYIGPYPLIDTTINLVKGDNLAWQERKGASFVFTPWYCGYEIVSGSHMPENSKVAPEGFRPTLQFAYAGSYGIHLGTAVAISGAAASPNQGYQSSPAAAFLMTMFNARLGWWIGNPRRAWAWRRESPKSGLLYLLAELTGSTNDRSSFVNLSDGGHFDNLGVYELVRRSCRYILAIDAEQDGDLTFGALGGAIRKCRIDFGVDIDIDLRKIRHVRLTKNSRMHFAQGTIHYPDGERGVLIYLKSSLTDDEPADVQQYGVGHKEFPHQSTADQWFSESQFESYRMLGEHMIETLCELDDAAVPVLLDRHDVGRWFEGLQVSVQRKSLELEREDRRRAGTTTGAPTAVVEPLASADTA